MSEYLYGRNSFKEALRNRKVDAIYILKDHPLLAEIKKQNLNYKIVDRKELDKLSHGNNHQGVVALVSEYETVALNSLIKKDKGLIVMLDGVSDPHNLGAIMRTCDCIGADGLIIKKHGSAPLNATVAKVSSGAIEHVKVAIVNNLVTTLKSLKKNDYWIIGAEAGGNIDYTKLPVDRNLVIVMGAEGSGLSRLVRAECDYLVSLPMHGHLDSLNVSVAAGILLYRIYSDRNPQ